MKSTMAAGAGGRHRRWTFCLITIVGSQGRVWGASGSHYWNMPLEGNFLLAVDLPLMFCKWGLWYININCCCSCQGDWYRTIIAYFCCLHLAESRSYCSAFVSTNLWNVSWQPIWSFFSFPLLSAGPTDLSMKRQLASSSGSSSSSSSRPQLSPTEINAVRQLVAGYRESAAFLLRSADELENLILQQNWVMWPSHRPGLISEFPLMTFWFPRAHTSVTAQSFRRVNYHNATLFLIHKVMC